LAGDRATERLTHSPQKEDDKMIGLSSVAAIARAIGSGDWAVLLEYLEQGQLAQPQISATVATTYPGTGVAYVNPGPYLQSVTISGGTVTVITLSRGGVTGLTAGQFILAPGDGVTCTSSGTPTVFNVTNLI
jgi:hypothetical protein